MVSCRNISLSATVTKLRIYHNGKYSRRLENALTSYYSFWMYNRVSTFKLSLHKWPKMLSGRMKWLLRSVVIRTNFSQSGSSKNIIDRILLDKFEFMYNFFDYIELSSIQGTSTSNTFPRVNCNEDWFYLWWRNLSWLLICDGKSSLWWWKKYSTDLRERDACRKIMTC